MGAQAQHRDNCGQTPKTHVREKRKSRDPRSAPDTERNTERQRQPRNEHQGATGTRPATATDTERPARQRQASRKQPTDRAKERQKPGSSPAEKGREENPRRAGASTVHAQQFSQSRAQPDTRPDPATKPGTRPATASPAETGTPKTRAAQTRTSIDRETGPAARQTKRQRRRSRYNCARAAGRQKCRPGAFLRTVQRRDTRTTPFQSSRASDDS